MITMNTNKNITKIKMRICHFVNAVFKSPAATLKNASIS